MHINCKLDDNNDSGDNDNGDRDNGYNGEGWITQQLGRLDEVRGLETRLRLELQVCFLTFFFDY